MKNIFMIVNRIGTDKAGATTAMLNRSEMFYKGGMKADIVTFDYKVDYEEVRNTLIQQGKMYNKTKIHNAFDYYKKKSSSKRFTRNKKLYELLKNKLANTSEIKENKNITLFFDKTSGEYVAYKRYFKETNEIIIDIFEYNKIKERFSLKNNLIHKKEIFNEENNLSFEIFYDHKSFPFISREINPENGSIGKTYLISEELEFKRNVDFCTHFLEEFIKDDSNNIMICDGPGSFPRMLNTHHKKTKKFSVIHAHHYKYFDNTGEKKKLENKIIKNADKIDGVVVLTEEQKKDIKSEYNVNNIYSISNSIKIPREPDHKKQGKVVGHISRLVPIKGLPYLIDVAEKVIQLDKEVTFEIYGIGSEENKIQQLINDKKLNENVTLLGYTRNPQKVLKNFKCLLSTSQYEGQGLSMIEAMTAEVPVIAFDIKYGPNDFIKNGENGYLIENLDTEAMAKRVLEVVNDDTLSNSLGENARKTIIENYSSDKLLKKWNSLFNK